MFKRLRDNLFGRPDQVPADGAVGDDGATAPDEEAAAHEPTSPDPSGAVTTEPSPASALPAGGPVRATATTSQAPAPAPTYSTPGPASAQRDAIAIPDGEQQAEDAADERAPHHEVAKPGRFSNPFRAGLTRTRGLFGRVNQVLQSDEIDETTWDDLEETLISSDVGVATSERLLATLRERVQVEAITRGSQLREALKEELELLLGDPEPLVFSDTSPLSVFLVVGVNGVGKTTSIAKLGNTLKHERHRVLLAAGDTFRAAATEQIKLWGERIGVPVISHQYGADPAAVVFDAVQAAQARHCDVLIVDTAGRLHTKFNLMEELKKVVRVLQKYDQEAPHEVLLVIDATTGQNGFLQAQQFITDAGVSGVILTKLDGTARGGIVFAIAAELGLPIKFVGTGEQLNDFAPFDPGAFVDALFDDA